MIYYPIIGPYGGIGGDGDIGLRLRRPEMFIDETVATSPRGHVATSPGDSLNYEDITIP